MSELSSAGNLDEFLRQFVVRAADFLGFGRAFVGLLEGGVFRVRWGAENGQPGPVDEVFPDGVASRALPGSRTSSPDSNYRPRVQAQSGRG